ncbi:hypothetical protein V6N13_038343 [Hibiscus sabdariffa]
MMCCVCSPTVRIIASQTIDLSLTPDKRTKHQYLSETERKYNEKTSTLLGLIDGLISNIKSKDTSLRDRELRYNVTVRQLTDENATMLHKGTVSPLEMEAEALLRTGWWSCWERHPHLSAFYHVGNVKQTRETESLLLQNLVYLDLSLSGSSGSILPQIGDLSSLEYLDLLSCTQPRPTDHNFRVSSHLVLMLLLNVRQSNAVPLNLPFKWRKATARSRQKKEIKLDSPMAS